MVLAEKCDLELTDEQVEILKVITQFNISAGYDDYKESFYKKCTYYTSKKHRGGICMVKKIINEEIMESIKRHIEKISQFYNIEAIILFGSYAKGTENENSDIDIVIISSDFDDIIEDGANLIGYTWKIDTRIEPHPVKKEDYENISTPFVQEIINTGIKVA